MAITAFRWVDSGGWSKASFFVCLCVCMCVSGVIDVLFGVTLWELEIEGCGEGDDEFCCLGYSVWRGGKSRRGR